MTIATPMVRNMNNIQLFLLLLAVAGAIIATWTGLRVWKRDRRPLDTLLTSDTPDDAEKQS